MSCRFLPVLLLAACSILPEPASEPRWLDPLGALATEAGDVHVRLRAVVAASILDEAVMLRVAPHEVELSGEWRWTDEPAALVKRLLERRLVAADVPTLDVTVELFELDVQDEPRARVRLVARLLDAERRTLLHRAFEAEEPCEDEPGAVAAAMGRALDAACSGLVAALP